MSPVLSGERRDVSLGKRTRKGVVVLRNAPLQDPGMLASIFQKLTQGRMSDLESSDVRFLAGNAGRWYWLRFSQRGQWELQTSLASGGEHEAWEWMEQDHRPPAARPPAHPISATPATHADAAHQATATPT